MQSDFFSIFSQLFSTHFQLMTCDIWDTDYNIDKWESGFMTIFVTWQLMVTLESIRNSCNVFTKELPQNTTVVQSEHRKQYSKVPMTVPSRGIWGMSGACLGQHLGHIANNGQQSAGLHASVMPFLFWHLTWHDIWASIFLSFGDKDTLWTELFELSELF